MDLLKIIIEKDLVGSTKMVFYFLFCVWAKTAYKLIMSNAKMKNLYIKVNILLNSHYILYTTFVVVVYVQLYINVYNKCCIISLLQMLKVHIIYYTYLLQDKK